jgi:hypothetical protein
MRNRVFMFVVIALTLAISAGAAYNQEHRPATMKWEAGRCCGDPLCPPPGPCQRASGPPRFQSQR